MKDVVLNEVKRKELKEEKIREVLENICKYFKQSTSLIEKYVNKKSI